MHYALFLLAPSLELMSGCCMATGSPCFRPQFGWSTLATRKMHRMKLVHPRVWKDSWLTRSQQETEWHCQHAFGALKLYIYRMCTRMTLSKFHVHVLSYRRECKTEYKFMLCSKWQLRNRCGIQSRSIKCDAVKLLKFMEGVSMCLRLYNFES